MSEQQASITLTTPEFKQKLASLYAYLAKHLAIQQAPKVKLVTSKQNASNPFGLTGHYDHTNHIITVYITDRHDTDILRSFAHEVIHHWQNLRGVLHPEETHTAETPVDNSTRPHYAQQNPHLRKKEMEAYLFGNILFRDWQDENRMGPPDIEPFMPALINENLAIQNPDKLKKSIKGLLQYLSKDGTIASYHRDRTSGDMNPEDFVEEFTQKIMSALQSLVQTINNKGNWENQPNMIAESVTVTVGGATVEYPELHTVEDIGFDLGRSVLWPTLEKQLGEDEKEKFRKEGNGAETLTSDGDDHFNPTGILNFYIGGIPERFISKLLKGFQERLETLGIEYGAPRGPEQSKMFKSQVIRIPITKNPNAEHEKVPELNMANRNYQVLFHKILGLVGDDDWSFSFPVETLEKALVPYVSNAASGKLKPYTIEPGKVNVEPPPLPGDEWKGQEDPMNQLHRALGSNVYDAGLELDQLLRYIEQLWKIVQWAKTHGYKQISGG